MTLEELHSWAIEQGATHYMRKLTPPAVTISATAGVMRLLESDDFLSLRLAGCLLFHPELDLELLLLKLSEDGKVNLSHIVSCGRRVEPEEELWIKLQAEVGSTTLEDAPHWSRFCTHGEKGYSYMGQKFVWLRPNKELFDSLMKRDEYGKWKP